MLIIIISMTILIGIDQWLNFFIQTNQIGVIEKIKILFLEIAYKEDILQILGRNLNFLSIIFSIILIIVFIVMFFDKYAKKVRTRFNFIPFILSLSGLISNLITKISKGFSIKYITMPKLLNNTYLNIADIYVYLGVLLLVVFYLIKILDSKVEKGYEVNENNSTK